MAENKVIDTQVAAGKIATAVQTRRDSQTVINARTDALAPCGIEEAPRAGQRFQEVGADVVLIDPPPSIDDLAPIWLTAFARTGQLPEFTVPNMRDPGAAAPTFSGVYGQWTQTPPPSWRDVRGCARSGTAVHGRGM